MDPASSLPGSPGGPLHALSPERVNQQRDSAILLSSMRSDLRDSSVHDKISQFNTLSIQSKHLERKTADAALKRAMLGREEAESEMRRYRDEARSLRKQVDEGKERERRVGERLETVMVRSSSYFRILSSPCLANDVVRRKTTAVQRRRTHTPKPSGRRRSAAPARTPSRARAPSSNCKKK